MILSAFAVLRHAEQLATRLGEPMGTVILTLSVTGIEVMMIAAFMLNLSQRCQFLPTSRHSL